MIRILAVLAALLSGTYAAAAPRAVPPAPIAATCATLASTVATAPGGTVVSLSGACGDVYIRGSGRIIAPPLTIDASAAIFKSLRFDSITGLRLRNLSLAGGGVKLVDVHDVGIVNILSIGAVRAGVEIGASTDVTLTHGEFVDAGSDGVDVADSQRVTIRGILCYGSKPTPGAHPDCFQGYGRKGGPGLVDVTVADSVAVGDTQGFVLFGNAAPASRIVFDNLTVMTRFSRGISMTGGGGCTDCQLTNSRVLIMRGARYTVQIDPSVSKPVGTWSGRIENSSGNAALPPGVR